MSPQLGRGTFHDHVGTRHPSVVWEHPCPGHRHKVFSMKQVGQKREFIFMGQAWQ